MAEGWDVEEPVEDEVSFLIGMRWSELWRLAATPWVGASFAAMLGGASREDGLLATSFSVRPAGPVVVQRWRSAAELHRWARARRRPHAPAWGRFAREEGSTAAWGVWHEVRPAR
jgi:hypothetical protein